MEENTAKFYLSAVTIAEIEDGIAKLRRKKAGRKAEGLSAWLNALLHLYGERVLSFGVQEARIAGALSCEWPVAGICGHHNRGDGERAQLDPPHEESAPFQTAGREDRQSL
jgi:hypothetical protein